MSIQRTLTRLSARDTYQAKGPNPSIVFQERTKGWPGSGFNTSTEHLSARAVRPAGEEAHQVQIGFDITHYFDKTSRKMIGNMILDPGEFLDLAAHVIAGMDPVVQRAFLDNLPGMVAKAAIAMAVEEGKS